MSSSHRHWRRALAVLGLAGLLAACAPAALAPLPTLVPTFTPRAATNGGPGATVSGANGAATPTALIAPGSGNEPTLTPTGLASPTPTLLLVDSPATVTDPASLSTPAGGATISTPAGGATPTPLIAPPPSPTPYSPLAPLAYVPAGEFSMGSAPGTDAFAEQWERPAHTVALSAFWLETLEVSNSRYALCVAAGACSLPLATGSRTRPDYYTNPAFADYPMVNVTHAQAQSFCAWAGGRLPTEAEWEYAARFPDGRRYPWGNELDLGRGHFARGEGSDTERVETYATGASALGLLNLAGNVWEWVLDWYDPEYYAVSPRQDPPGPAAGTERVARGGAYATDPQFVRTANRLGRDPNRGFDNVGFRCAVGEPPANAPRLPTVTPSPPAP